MVRQTLPKTILSSVGTTVIKFYKGVENGTQLRIEHGCVGIYDQGEEWGTVDR